MITFSKISKIVLLAVFLFVNIVPERESSASEILSTLSPIVQGDALVLKGINILPNEPLRLNFIFGNNSEAGVNADAYERQVSYFMAGLTIPARDLWVNLSPVESDRITSDSLRQTQMGRELLSQDYQLKKAVSDILSPQNEEGKAIWEEFYQALYRAHGSADVPIDALNKIWIVPGDADIIIDGNTAVIARSSLKVMLEEDYLNGRKTSLLPSDVSSQADRPQFIREILRKHLLPLVEREVNTSGRFQPLRQVYHALILAEWYKHNIHNRILNQSYANKSLMGGIDFDARADIDEIFKAYCEHFQRRDAVQIQDAYDPSTQSVVPRQYVTGGFQWEDSFEARVQRNGAAAFLQGQDQFLSVAFIPEETDDFAMLDQGGLGRLSIDDAIEKIYDFYEGEDRTRSIEEILFSIYRYDGFLFTAEAAEEIAKTERLPYVIYFLQTLMKTEKYDNGYRANGYDPYLFSGSQILNLFRLNPDLEEFDRLLQPFRDEGIISANVIFRKILKQLSVKQAPKEKSIETRSMDLRKFVESSYGLEKSKRAKAIQKHLVAMRGKGGALVNQRTKVMIGSFRKLAGRLVIIPELVSLESEKFVWTPVSFSYVFLSPRSNHDVVRLARFLAEQGFSADKTGTIILASRFSADQIIDLCTEMNVLKKTKEMEHIHNVLIMNFLMHTSEFKALLKKMLEAKRSINELDSVDMRQLRMLMTVRSINPTVRGKHVFKVIFNNVMADQEWSEGLKELERSLVLKWENDFSDEQAKEIISAFNKYLALMPVKVNDRINDEFSINVQETIYQLKEFIRLYPGYRPEELKPFLVLFQWKDGPYFSPAQIDTFSKFQRLSERLDFLQKIMLMKNGRDAYFFQPAHVNNMVRSRRSLEEILSLIDFLKDKGFEAIHIYRLIMSTASGEDIKKDMEWFEQNSSVASALNKEEMAHFIGKREMLIEGFGKLSATANAGQRIKAVDFLVASYRDWHFRKIHNIILSNIAGGRPFNAGLKVLEEKELLMKAKEIPRALAEGILNYYQRPENLVSENIPAAAFDENEEAVIRADIDRIRNYAGHENEFQDFVFPILKSLTREGKVVFSAYELGKSLTVRQMLRRLDLLERLILLKDENGYVFPSYQINYVINSSRTLEDIDDLIDFFRARGFDGDAISHVIATGYSTRVLKGLAESLVSLKEKHGITMLTQYKITSLILRMDVIDAFLNEFGHLPIDKEQLSQVLTVSDQKEIRYFLFAIKFKGSKKKLEEMVYFKKSGKKVLAVFPKSILAYMDNYFNRHPLSGEALVDIVYEFLQSKALAGERDMEESREELAKFLTQSKTVISSLQSVRIPHMYKTPQVIELEGVLKRFLLNMQREGDAFFTEDQAFQVASFVDFKVKKDLFSYLFLKRDAGDRRFSFNGSVAKDILMLKRPPKDIMSLSDYLLEKGFASASIFFIFKSRFSDSQIRFFISQIEALRLQHKSELISNIQLGRIMERSFEYYRILEFSGIKSKDDIRELKKDQLGEFMLMLNANIDKKLQNAFITQVIKNRLASKPLLEGVPDNFINDVQRMEQAEPQLSGDVVIMMLQIILDTFDPSVKKDKAMMHEGRTYGGIDFSAISGDSRSAAFIADEKNPEFTDWTGLRPVILHQTALSQAPLLLKN